MIGDNITVTILRAGRQIQIGIQAPRGITVHRAEVHERILRQAEQQEQCAVGGAALPV